MISPTHIIGIVLTIGILLLASIYSGRRVKDSRSFTTGGNSGSWMVCGTILGTLVGGQSTIGTAQLAFCYGISAWWFTIGAALGALVLAAVYAKPIRHSGCTTLLEIVAKAYGRKAETIGSSLFLIGIFISIMAQVLSSSAMMTSLLGIPLAWSATISAILIALFVLFGGIHSAGIGGIIKLVLLYIGCTTAGIMVLLFDNGIAGTYSNIERIFALPTLRDANGLSSIESIHDRYGNILARGVMKDIGGCISLMLGVVTTQTYAQGIWSGATTEKARRGGLYCAILIPIIGAACTLVGLYMRGHYITASELATLQSAGTPPPNNAGVIPSSLEAFPAFVLNHMPPWLGGIALGAMFVNIMGCGSGLSLGAATIVVRDIIPTMSDKTKIRPKGIFTSQLTQTRITIAAILALAAVSVLSVKGSFINDLGFLSLGLRAVALLFPLSFALFLPQHFKQQAITHAMIIGTAVMLAAQVLALPGAPVYYGLFASLLVILIPNFLPFRKEKSDKREQ